jgi:hypothetical protein
MEHHQRGNQRYVYVHVQLNEGALVQNTIPPVNKIRVLVCLFQVACYNLYLVYILEGLAW